MSVHSDSSPFITPGATLTSGNPWPSNLHIHVLVLHCLTCLDVRVASFRAWAQHYTSYLMPAVLAVVCMVSCTSGEAHPSYSILLPDGSSSSEINSTYAPCTTPWKFLDLQTRLAV